MWRPPKRTAATDFAKPALAVDAEADVIEAADRVIQRCVYRWRLIGRIKAIGVARVLVGQIVDLEIQRGMFAEIEMTADVEIKLARHIVAGDRGMVAVHRRRTGGGAGYPEPADHAFAEPAFIDEEAPIVGVITLVEEDLPVRGIAVIGASRFHDGGARDSGIGDEFAHIGGQEAK